MVTPQDIRNLRQELIAAGVFERREAQTWAKLALLLGAAFSLIALHTQLPLWASVLLLPVTAFFLGSAAMIGHEGGHRSLSKSSFRCELVFHLLFPVLGSLGVLMWRDKHNVRHHGHPNIVGVDTDMQLWPLAHTREAHLGAGRVRRLLQRHIQAYAWWPLTTFFTWSIKSDSLKILIAHARKQGIDRAWLLDVAAQLLHYVGWIVVPSLIWGFWPVFAFYLALMGTMSLLLALVFAPGHMGLPIRHDHPDGWLLQFETSRNLIMPRWLSFFFIGLDYQIEHHLFPKIPHGHLARASVIVQRWAAAHRIAYHRLPYLRAVAEVTRYVGMAWRLPAVPAGANGSGPGREPVER